MKVLCALWKSKSRVKSGLRKQQYTVKLFYCNHLTPVIALWQMQKFMSLYKFLLCLIFNLRAIGNFHDDDVWLQLPEFISSLLSYLNLSIPLRFIDNSLNLHKKTANWRILVVVVKWRHRAIVLFPRTGPGGLYSKGDFTEGFLA